MKDKFDDIENLNIEEDKKLTDQEKKIIRRKLFILLVVIFLTIIVLFFILFQKPKSDIRNFKLPNIHGEKELKDYEDGFLDLNDKKLEKLNSPLNLGIFPSYYDFDNFFKTQSFQDLTLKNRLNLLANSDSFLSFFKRYKNNKCDDGIKIPLLDIKNLYEEVFGEELTIASEAFFIVNGFKTLSLNNFQFTLKDDYFISSCLKEEGINFYSSQIIGSEKKKNKIITSILVSNIKGDLIKEKQREMSFIFYLKNGRYYLKEVKVK